MAELKKGCHYVIEPELTYTCFAEAARNNSFNREQLQKAFNNIEQSDPLLADLFTDIDLYSNRLGTGDQKQGNKSVQYTTGGEMIMRAYSEEYLNDVVENQGKLFDFVAQTFPDKDTEDFINTYMASKTRKSIDEEKAYVNTMFAQELWEYFCKTEQYMLKSGKALEGFMPDWIGEFYAYYQWYFNIPSSEVIKKVPVDFLKKAYYGLHDLELDLAVQKVGNE